MQNSVPSSPEVAPKAGGSVASRSVERALGRRRDRYELEVRRLVEASLELIRATGCLEPRVGEIVASAGLSNQAFYRHFRSKDELLVAVLDQGLGVLRGYLAHRMGQHAAPAQQVRAWLAGMLEQALDPEAAAATRPFAVARGRLADSFPAEVRESEAQLTSLLLESLRAGVRDGELDAQPERDAQLLYDLAMGWMQRKLVTPGESDRDEAQHLIEFAMRGLSAWRAAEGVG